MYVPLCFIRFATVNLSVPGARSMALAVLPLPALFEYLSACCLDCTALKLQHGCTGICLLYCALKRAELWGSAYL